MFYRFALIVKSEFQLDTKRNGTKKAFQLLEGFKVLILRIYILIEPVRLLHLILLGFLQFRS